MRTWTVTDSSGKVHTVSADHAQADGKGAVNFWGHSLNFNLLASFHNPVSVVEVITPYKMNPETDKIMFTRELAAGMTVLMEDEYLRQYRKRESFAKVLKIIRDGEHYNLILESPGGYQESARGVGSFLGWIVKK